MQIPWVGICVGALFLGSLSAQERVGIDLRVPSKSAADSVAHISWPRVDLRVDVPLVLIPVHVSTLLGAAVTGLERGNFHLLEDNIPQKITHFALEDAPLSIGLVFDLSGSMQNKIGKAREAAREILKTSDAADEFFLVEFNERPHLSVRLTVDAEEVHQALLAAKPRGRTSLLDAVHVALAEMKHARNQRKAVVIISDGGDNHSRFSEAQIRDAVRESDVQIYAMGIFDLGASARLAPEERNGPRLLDEMAAESGGMSFTVGRVDDLPGVCTRIAEEMRTEYLLGYSPTNPVKDGKYRRVKVTVAPSEPVSQLRTYYRPGYFAPND